MNDILTENFTSDQQRARAGHLAQGLVVCDCGAIHEEASREIHQLRGQVSELTDEVAENEHTIKRVNKEANNYERKWRRLRKEADQQLKAHPLFMVSMEVLEYWRELCHPNARELEGERCRKVIARLEGKPKPYSKDELKRCVYGYSHFPFIVNGRRSPAGSPGQRYIDAELVFRDPKHVDQGLAMADEADRRAEGMPNLPPPTTVVAQLSYLGQWALKWAERGYHIFPILPRDKRPMEGSRGLSDATTDRDRIERFWRNNPDHNIGVRCGHESQLVVLDVDDDAGGLESLRALVKKHGPIPSTGTVVTPGGGTHYYFRHPDQGEIRNTQSFPGPGLDIRGIGGYVLAPPSMGSNGSRYEFDEQAPKAPMPDWLVRAVVSHQTAVRNLNTDFAAMVRAGVSEGARDEQLTSLVGHLWQNSVSPNPGEIFELVNSVNLAKCRPPLSAKQVEKIVKSIERREGRKALRGLTS